MTGEQEGTIVDPLEKPWLVFIAVAVVVLGVLLAVARLVSADASAVESTPVSLQPVAPVQVDEVDIPLIHYVPLPPAAPAAEPVAEVACPPAACDASPAPAPEEAPAVAPPPPPPPPMVPAPAIGGKAAAVIERTCGAVLYGFNERQRLPPASLTKIVTAIVSIERADVRATLVADVSAKYLNKTTESSVMGLEPGKRATIADLLYGLMLPSGNDAALALAKHVGGSVQGFVGLMNEKARQIGLADTNFTNPHGLDESGLYSTALDMAQAGRAYLAYPALETIARAQTYRWGDVDMKNGNSLLRTYPGAFGVKIGFTDLGRQTIVAAADRNGRDIIVSVLGTENRNADAAALLDWAFDHTQSAC